MGLDIIRPLLSHKMVFFTLHTRSNRITLYLFPNLLNTESCLLLILSTYKMQ